MTKNEEKPTLDRVPFLVWPLKDNCEGLRVLAFKTRGISITAHINKAVE